MVAHRVAQAAASHAPLASRDMGGARRPLLLIDLADSGAPV